MLTPEVFQSVCAYFLERPDELMRIVRNATALKLGVPLAALRWAATQAKGQRVPSDVVIEAEPPAVRVGATVPLMGSQVRASALVLVEELRLNAYELRVELRVREVNLRLVGGGESPLAALVQSGALDLSKLGNLIGAMPRRPEYLVEAEGDRIVLDLKRHPLMRGQKAEMLLGLITPLITIESVRSAPDHLDVKLGVLQRGLGAAISSWKALF